MGQPKHTTKFEPLVTTASATRTPPSTLLQLTSTFPRQNTLPLKTSMTLKPARTGNY